MATNIPATEWRPTDGLSEYIGEDIKYIVDNTSTFLVDPSGTF